MVFRDHGRVRSTGTAPPVTDLDALPIPDHSDFFAAVSEASWVGAGLPEVSMESSRGCWWAQARCCGFCALNAFGRVYRTKSPARILAEMRELSGRWNVRRLCLVDNLVSTRLFLRDVLPALARDPLPVPIFLEVRPDLSREQIRARQASRADPAGNRESERPRPRADGEGSRRTREHPAPEVVQDLRRDAVLEHALRAAGRGRRRLRAGPGTAPLADVPSPASGLCRGETHRFSPFCERPEEYGFEKIVPLAAYPYLYPFGSASLTRIAGAFAYGCDPPAVSDSEPPSCETRSTSGRRRTAIRRRESSNARAAVSGSATSAREATPG